MKNLTVPFAVIVAVLASTLFLPSSARAQTAAATYKAKCAGCHGADGKAGTAPGKALGAHDFGSAEVTKESDADLKNSCATERMTKRGQVLGKPLNTIQ